MINVPENELFSAYLDGELTADEQAGVEQLLATSPAARQLLDELRNLSATLQSLPPERLGEDLSDRVLREAERRILSGQPGPRSRNGADGHGPSSGGSLFRRFFRPRTFFWSALAVAVAIILSIQERPAPQNRVAQAPKAPLSIRASEEPAEHAPQPELRAAPPGATAPNAVAAPEPADEATRAEESKKAAPEPTPAMPTLKPAPAPAAVAADQPPAAETETPAETEAAPTAAMAHDEPAGKSAPASEATDAPPAAAVAAEPRKAAPVAEPPAGPQEPSASPAAVAEKPAPAETPSAEPDADAPKVETLIVRCDVSPNVFQKELFDQILSEHKVRVVEPPAEDERQESGQAIELADPVEIQTYYLDVTSQQIAAVMRDMRSRPDEFRSVRSESNQALAANTRRGAVIGGQSLAQRSTVGRATIRLGPSAGGSSTGAVSASPRPGTSARTVTPNSGGITFRATIGAKPSTGDAKAAEKKPAAKPSTPKTFRVRFVLRAVESATPAESPAAGER